MTVSADSVARDLRGLIRGDVEFDPGSRVLYATDAGLTQIQPLGVVSPRDAADVIRLVQYAADRDLSVVPRGMGSGLNGGAVGAGIQVDFTRYMNSILEIASDASWVRVQPGVVPASLNRHLQKFGVFFAPDPSSENHCSLGGMVGTNASGARSVAYGATKDHVLALDVVLSDGSLYKARPLDCQGEEWAALQAGGTAAGRAFSTVLPALWRARDLIQAGLPYVVKNSCGYRIEAVLDDLGPLPCPCAGKVPTPAGRQAAFVAPPAAQTAPEAPRAQPAPGAAAPGGLAHLQRLFVGAEGTLGLVTEATLHLVPLPARRGVAMTYFPSLSACGEVVPGILALQPTAVEIMDSRFLAIARRHDSRIHALLPEHTNTALLIEFEAESDEELGEKFSMLKCHLANSGALGVARAATAAETEHLWRVRKSAVALMQRAPGPRRPLPFIEDIAVHPAQLLEYMDFLQRLFEREAVDAVMVGHMGDGNLHTRPLLNPKDPVDVRTMQRIYDEVSAYVLSVRGTLSGEHGDGLVHTPRLRDIYGDDIYRLFTQIKTAFDPLGIMNPGKKVGPQQELNPFLDNVRYGPGYRTMPQRPLLHFAPHEYEDEIERCHGCGVCKSTVATSMCPTYKATRREHASPRAKANLLRALITGTLGGDQAYGHAAVKQVIDYCIGCGLCAGECPSGVNIPKLMLEAKSRCQASQRADPAEMLLGRAETVARLGHFAAPVANRIINRPVLRRMAEPLLGIDRRRPVAPFATKSFADILRARAGGAAPRPSRTAAPVVAYFYDLFANYNDPDLALTVERVLAAHGFQVVYPEQRSSGIPEMLYGYAGRARDIAKFNVQALLPYVMQGDLVVSAEPTATFALKVHYSDYLSSPDCSLVANATLDLGQLLVRRRLDEPESVPPVRALSSRVSRSRLTTFSPSTGGDVVGDRPLRVGYHQPCHLKAQQVGSPMLQLLNELPGLQVIDLATGCCGMAGTFGMKTDTYELSLAAGAPLFERIGEVAPDLLASECSACRMQLAHATALETIHPIRLLAEAYGV